MTRPMKGERFEFVEAGGDVYAGVVTDTMWDDDVRPRMELQIDKWDNVDIPSYEQFSVSIYPSDLGE